MVVSALLIAAAIAVVAGFVVAAAGYGGELAPAGGTSSPRRGGIGVPSGRRLRPADLEQWRLSPGLWGYPPRQVDELVDRAAGALAERDAYIAELERRLDAARGGAGRPADRDGGES